MKDLFQQKLRLYFCRELNFLKRRPFKYKSNSGPWFFRISCLISSVKMVSIDIWSQSSFSSAKSLLFFMNSIVFLTSFHLYKIKKLKRLIIQVSAIYLELLDRRQLSDLDLGSESWKLLNTTRLVGFDEHKTLLWSVGTKGEYPVSVSSRMQLKLSISKEKPFSNFLFLLGVDVGDLKFSHLSLIGPTMRRTIVTSYYY